MEIKLKKSLAKTQNSSVENSAAEDWETENSEHRKEES